MTARRGIGRVRYFALCRTKGPSSIYCYDGLNNLTKLVIPDTTYDPAGTLLTKIDVRKGIRGLGSRKKFEPDPFKSSHALGQDVREGPTGTAPPRGSHCLPSAPELAIGACNTSALTQASSTWPVASRAAISGIASTSPRGARVLGGARAVAG